MKDLCFDKTDRGECPKYDEDDNMIEGVDCDECLADMVAHRIDAAMDRMKYGDL